MKSAARETPGVSHAIGTTISGDNGYVINSDELNSDAHLCAFGRQRVEVYGGARSNNVLGRAYIVVSIHPAVQFQEMITYLQNKDRIVIGKAQGSHAARAANNRFWDDDSPSFLRRQEYQDGCEPLLNVRSMNTERSFLLWVLNVHRST